MRIERESLASIGMSNAEYLVTAQQVRLKRQVQLADKKDSESRTALVMHR